MKTTVSLDLQVEMGCGGVCGTGLMGYLPNGTKYKAVVRVFGKPQFGKSADGKIQSEWVGRINGLAFTIYDYKSQVNPQENTLWHIGGKQKLVADLVKVYFKEALKSPI